MSSLLKNLGKDTFGYDWNETLLFVFQPTSDAHSSKQTALTSFWPSAKNRPFGIPSWAAEHLAKAEKKANHAPPLIPLKPIDPTYVETSNACRINKYYNQTSEVSLEQGFLP
jgi:hypothetical protein